MTDPADLPAVDLLAAFAARRLSPVEALDAVLARIERAEPSLCALYALDPDGARAAARESEARWLRGEARGLEGVACSL
jgi:aspartyl-tRNA(Asn)/glutamyl-tRNA(Gln) amidotransferase subunit A